MKLYRDAVLRNEYDVIAVGAGLGGMTAASLLAKRGLSVLIVDQQNKPGGACTSFECNQLLKNYQAVYTTNPGLIPNMELNAAWMGNDWKNEIDTQTGQLLSQPKVFIGDEYSTNAVSVEEAVAIGRNMACSISEILRSQAG
jgi:RAB protein geranylgeranyltransferase component A